MKLSNLFSNPSHQLTENNNFFEIQRVVQAISYGKINERINTPILTGEMQQVGNLINQMLDAMTQPLNATSNYIERISKGDMPPKITDSYNGDFNTVKNNLNLVIDAINQQTTAAQRIAEGDLSVKIDVRSENDIVAKSLIRIIEVQQGLQKELRQTGTIQWGVC